MDNNDCCTNKELTDIPDTPALKISLIQYLFPQPLFEISVAVYRFCKDLKTHSFCLWFYMLEICLNIESNTFN